MTTMKLKGFNLEERLKPLFDEAEVLVKEQKAWEKRAKKLEKAMNVLQAKVDAMAVTGSDALRVVRQEWASFDLRSWAAAENTLDLAHMKKLLKNYVKAQKAAVKGATP